MSSIEGDSSLVNIVKHISENDSLNRSFKTPLIFTTPEQRKTKSTISTTTISNDVGSGILAIAEGRGLARGEIGITSVDLMSPVLTLSQFSDSPTYGKLLTKINALNPTEIIMSTTSCDFSNTSRIYKLICNNFPDIKITPVQRKYFNESKGLEYIKNLCIVDYSKCIVELNSKYYCLASCAALIKYVECIKNIIYAPHSIPVIFQGAEKTAIIDPATSKYLELITNAQDPKSLHSLYATLNFTKTRSGSRFLRANLLQPPSDLETMNFRLDAISDFLDNDELFYGLQNILTQFVDVEHLLSLCVQIQKQENIKSFQSKILYTLYLKHTLQLVKPLQTLLSHSNSQLIKAYANVLADERFELIKKEIDQVIEENAKYQKGQLNIKFQKCIAIKKDINGLLDITRRTYAEAVEDINIYIKTVADSSKLPIKVSYNNTKFYHMQIYSKNISVFAQLPKEFIKISKTKNSISFTTEELINLNDRINDLTCDICTISNSILNDLFIMLRKNFSCLYKLIECITILDMLQSFAHISVINGYVRPQFGNILAVKDAIHPILQKISKNSSPNNIYVSNETSFIIITGANMSGKSTYLRQIAMLQIMAQCGSYVPAAYASFRISNQIFSRLGTDHDIELNSSSFEQEMIEMKYIIQNISERSLILIDELCRSTSSDEGIAISMALCEFIMSSNAFVFFATHLHKITCLDTMYPRIVNYHFVSDLIKSSGNHVKLIHTYTLNKGVCELEYYGIRLAQISCLPKNLIKDTNFLITIINNESKDDLKLSNNDMKKKSVFKLFSQLLQCARNSILEDDELLNYLKFLKHNFQEDYGNFI